MTATRRPLRSILVPGLVAVPLALALTACGSDDTTTAAATTPSPTSSSSEDVAQGEGPGTTDDTSLSAAATALAEVPGGRVVSVERESGSWEVHVVTSDGTESELRTSADGATVTRGPVTDAQDDANGDDDGDDAGDLARDRAQNAKLLQATKIDYRAAVDAAQGEVPSGAVSSLDLDLERGQARWDVTFGDNTPDEKVVTIDAATGAVLGTQRDD